MSEIKKAFDRIGEIISEMTPFEKYIYDKQRELIQTGMCTYDEKEIEEVLKKK